MRTPALIAKLLEPVYRRIAMLLATGEVAGVNDATKIQELKATLLAGETADRIRRPQPYGLTSVPEVGAALAVACVNGDRGHPIAFAVDDPRYRPTGLAAGEVALYSKHGQQLHLKSSGELAVTGAPTVKVSGATTVEVTASSLIKLQVGSTKIEIASTGVTITSPTGTATFT